MTGESSADGPIETPFGTLAALPASGWVAVSFDRALSCDQLERLRENWRQWAEAGPGRPGLVVLPPGARVCPIVEVKA